MTFNLPGPNKRVCAFLIDAIIFNMVGTGISAVTGMNLIWVISAIGIILKDCIDGQSIGRRIVGLQVLDAQDNPAQLATTAVRNFVMIVPILPIIEYIVMIRNKETGLRLGDQWAKSRVTDLRPDVPDGKYFWISLGIYLAVGVMVLFLSFVGAQALPK